MFHAITYYRFKRKKPQDSLGKPCRSVGVLDKTINLLLFRTTRKKIKDDFVKYPHHVTQTITNKNGDFRHEAILSSLN